VNKKFARLILTQKAGFRFKKRPPKINKMVELKACPEITNNLKQVVFENGYIITFINN